jgi:hypothetical protein
MMRLLACAALVVAVAAGIFTGMDRIPKTEPAVVQEEPVTTRPAPPTTLDSVATVDVPSTVTMLTEDTVPPESGWKQATATVFWVGESETHDNDYISNVMSAWDTRWHDHYGGLDDPYDRCGFEPCGFVPNENPFYVALPYNDRDHDGRRKANAASIPWDDPATQTSVLKNRWIEVRVGGKSCFGQWEDVGPFEDDDIAYVFGDADAANEFGVGAGIDLSPAMRDCLGVGGVAQVEWRHVEFDAVPQGPWTKTITTQP